MLCLILSTKLCCLPLADDFQVVSQSERITKYIMKMDLILYWHLSSSSFCIGGSQLGLSLPARGHEQVLEMCLIAVTREDRSEARDGGQQATVSRRTSPKEELPSPKS